MQRTPQDFLDDFLVLESQGGDRRAMGLLVERWHPRLLRHARAQLGREAHAAPQLASEVTQDAWVLINRNRAVREVKRVELQLARLAERIDRPTQSPPG